MPRGQQRDSASSSRGGGSGGGGGGAIAGTARAATGVGLAAATAAKFASRHGFVVWDKHDFELNWPQVPAERRAEWWAGPGAAGGAGLGLRRAYAQGGADTFVRYSAGGLNHGWSGQSQGLKL
jgi:hypothetical protein